MTESMYLPEAAKFLGIHEDTCAARTAAGEIPGCKVGRRWVYHRGLLDEYLRKKCQSTVEKGSVSV